METYCYNEKIIINKPSLMRHRIMSYVFSILQQEDFRGLSISKLCTDLGISRTTFYEHFGCKREVFLEVFEMFWNKVVKATEGLSYEDSMEFTIGYIHEIGKYFVI